MRLLLLSNSRSTDGVYLRWAFESIYGFLGKGVSKVLFVPFAGVPGTAAANSAYAGRVRPLFREMGYGLDSVHDQPDAVSAVRAAQAIVIGGGNTFHLLAQMQAAGLVDAIAERARAGVPYIGWSAGSVVACPTIATTNDMLIVEPNGFRGLSLVPFQINAHYTDAVPPGHQGETRAMRIAEFLELHPEATVVGLREGALLRVEQGVTHLFGTGARIFRAGTEPVELPDGATI